MASRDIIVVAASAGGLPPLQALAAGLPRGFPGALFVVQHVGTRRSLLPELLSQAGPLPATFAEDGMAVEPGRILVAPPDHHLLLGPGHVRLSRGPAENRTRPAADPLFRTTAEAYGPRVVGVVLSGMLADGTAGLLAVRRRGGVAVVQDPAEALYPGMPRSALAHVAVDHRLPAAAMPALLRRLARADPTVTEGAMSETGQLGGYRLDEPAALTCPACGGALKEERHEGLPYFTCHVGHRYAGPDMGEAQAAKMEEALEVALRTLNERASLAGKMADSMRHKGLSGVAARWDDARAQALDRAETLRRFLEQDWVRPGVEE